MPAVIESETPARSSKRSPQSPSLLVRRRELLTARMQRAQLLPPALTSPAEERNAGWLVLLVVGLAAGLVLLAYTLEFLARMGR